jgi:sialate O-acetylesterase
MRGALAATAVICLAGTALGANLPKENVIDVPAISEGLCVHNMFQSNMVLQRDKPISVWGWASPGARVTVSFAGKERAASAGPERSWRVTFPAMPAGSTPARMTVRDRTRTLTLENILLGDVWVLGGQSNMEFPLAKIENGNLEIVSANHGNIRILTVPAQNGPDDKQGFPRLHEWSSWSGRHFRKGEWDVCSPDTVRELSAIGYVFARRIHMASQIPIGVIDVSRGGTTVETWTPDPVLRKIDALEVRSKLAEWDEKVAQYDPQKDLEDRIRRHHEWVARMRKQGKKIPPDRQVPSDLRPGPAMNQNRPGNCYASMIAPIAGLAVKGAIFHQGYNNCFDGDRGGNMYYHIFPKMIAAWRAAFDSPEMPFGIITLCTAGGRQTLDDFAGHMADAGPHIREAQYKTFLDFHRAGDKNTGFTSTYDLRRRWYHPQLKIPAGERIARWALATQYGFDKQIRWKPPMVKEMKVEGDRIVLHMDESVSNVDDGGPIEGFAVAGKDKRYHPAQATHLVTGKDSRGRERKDTKVIVLKSPMVPEPVHYRYAWARSPLGNLQATGHSDVPFATQRSDTWSMEEIYTALTGKTAKAAGSLDRGERRELIKALRAEDMRRRLAEAEALIQEDKEEKGE